MSRTALPPHHKQVSGSPISSCLKILVGQMQLLRSPRWSLHTLGSVFRGMCRGFIKLTSQQTPAFFSIVSEMRDPRFYTRSLIVCQTTVTITYAVIGIVVYYFCGSYVASPALGSAGPLMKKICYGLALPGLLVTTTLVIHVSTNLNSEPSPS